MKYTTSVFINTIGDTFHIQLSSFSWCCSWWIQHKIYLICLKSLQQNKNQETEWLPYFSYDFRVKFRKSENIIDFKRTKQEHFGVYLIPMLISNLIYGIFSVSYVSTKSIWMHLAKTMLLTYRAINGLTNLSYYILSFLDRIACIKRLRCWVALLLYSLLKNYLFPHKWETFSFISWDKVWKIRKSFQESHFKSRVTYFMFLLSPVASFHTNHI